MYKRQFKNMMLTANILWNNSAKYNLGSEIKIKWNQFMDRTHVHQTDSSLRISVNDYVCIWDSGQWPGSTVRRIVPNKRETACSAPNSYASYSYRALIGMYEMWESGTQRRELWLVGAGCIHVEFARWHKCDGAIRCVTWVNNHGMAHVLLVS